jgi:hypothetical protein
MLKENSKKILEFVKANDGKDITAADIAEGTGLDVRVVNGSVTSAFQKKGLMERIPAEIELEDGTHKAIKLIRLTDAGRAFEDKEDAE